MCSTVQGVGNISVAKADMLSVLRELLDERGAGLRTAAFPVPCGRDCRGSTLVTVEHAGGSGS